MKALVFLGLVLALPSFARAAPGLEETYAAHGHLILAPFASAPFPHPVRAEGHTYQGILYSAKEHYSDRTVALFIPKGFREGGRVDFVVHFHGWNNSVAGTLGTFHLIEQLVASGKNAVLVVPEGPRNAPDSFGGKLEDADGFKRFMDEVVATLRDRGVLHKSPKDFSVGRIILSGHSGGYHVIASILDRGGLAKNADEVWLFDALYGQTDSYLNWADRTHGRLLNIYTDHGGTKDESEKLQSRLLARGTKIYTTEETALASDKRKTSQFVFIHTDLAHDDVVAQRNEFTLFLKTSALADR
ncbi:MAG: hypothetical protein EXS32_04560 [Opitutus sp.]|nr:hypothetical protein [Opitutus sp.]